jgi:hypothetical protein
VLQVKKTYAARSDDGKYVYAGTYKVTALENARVASTTHGVVCVYEDDRLISVFRDGCKTA